MAAISAFDGVGGGRQQVIVQKGQRLLECRTEELLERFAESGESAYPLPKFGELGQSGFSPAASVEEAVHLIHDFT